MLTLIYFLMQLTVAGLAIFAMKSSEEEFTRDNVLLIALLVTIAPLSLTGFGGFLLYDLMQNKRRKRVLKLMNDWEHIAAEKAGIPRWDWFRGSQDHKDFRHQCMRETVSWLSNDDLELLIKTAKNVVELDKPVRDAIVNEMVDRQLFNE